MYEKEIINTERYGIPKLTKLSNRNALLNLLQMHGQPSKHGQNVV
jgi:hypothetical protein